MERIKFTLEKKLGTENAKKVLTAISKDEMHFGFIQVTEEELAELTSLYNPSKMAMLKDVFSIRAGKWMVVIVVHALKDYVEVKLINPYDVNDNFQTTDI